MWALHPTRDLVTTTSTVRERLTDSMNDLELLRSAGNALDRSEVLLCTELILSLAASTCVLLLAGYSGLMVP